MDALSSLALPDINGLVEIICLAAAFYYILLFFRGTRAVPTMAGLALIFIGAIIATRIFHLDSLNWILQRFSVYLAVAVVVIFQPEIRRVLAELGKRHVPGASAGGVNLVEDVVKAAGLLSKRRIGALIGIEQDIGTRSIQETGVKIDAAVSPELLSSIFFPYTPLHDGGVIISGDRVAAARCIFPLSQRIEVDNVLGTRHRAALGLSEETDAIVVVISEETGKISCCHKGRLYPDLDEHRLNRFLVELLLKPQQQMDFWTRLRKAAFSERRQTAGSEPAQV